MIQFPFTRLNVQRSVWLTAFVLLIQTVQAQNIGIGTSNPTARLHVADSNVLFTGPNNVVNTTSANPPAQGPGARMMWYPQKAAFRAGLAFGNQWDKDSMGIISVGLGNSTKAMGESSFASGAGSTAYGDRSTAMGEGSIASGFASFAIGSNSIAAGRNAIAMGLGNVASNDYTVALGTSNTASGFAAFAFGQQSIASNNTSIAMGMNTIASGYSSVAMGQNAQASAQGSMAFGNNTRALSVYSTAMGIRAQASGDLSMSLGYDTRARSFGSITLGQFNDTNDVITPGFSLPTDRLFQLGNGTAAGRSNAMTVLRNGNAGLGTLQPLARFHVDNGAVLFTSATLAPGNQDTPIPPPTSGAGVRLMWYPEKAAFRAGFVNGALWDKDNIGKYSTGLGIDTKASGYAAVALGNSTIASGDFSSVLGDGNVASAYASFATGFSSYATAAVATSIGNDVNASGVAATAMGEGSRAKSYAGFVAGTYNDITDAPVGSNAVASDRIFQIGNGASNAARNNAITVLRSGNTGIGSVNPQQRLEVVAGPSANATKIVIGNRGGFGPAALEFVSDYGLSSQWRPGIIQSGDNGNFTGKLEFYTNGAGSGNLYGAVKGMEIRNGTVLTATGSVGSFSDERLKENIAPFTDGLNVINQINPVQFDYKANAPFASTQTQIGIIAQELEKIAPYMVRQTTEGNVQDMHWVDHQAYIFLLINAVKEQQQQLQEANKKIADMQAILQSLTTPKQ